MQCAAFWALPLRPLCAFQTSTREGGREGGNSNGARGPSFITPPASAPTPLAPTPRHLASAGRSVGRGDKGARRRERHVNGDIIACGARARWYTPVQVRKEVVDGGEVSACLPLSILTTLRCIQGSSKRLARNFFLLLLKCSAWPCLAVA